MGWEVHAPSFAALLDRLQRDYPLPPVYITENGAAFDDPAPSQGRVHDAPRTDYLRGHIDALQREDADILGMSALLTTTMPYMKVVIDTLKEKGMRENFIVLVGGAPLNEEFGKAIGADAYCRDAAVAVETAKAMVARKHNQL